MTLVASQRAKLNSSKLDRKKEEEKSSARIGFHFFFLGLRLNNYSAVVSLLDEMNVTICG